MVKKSLSCFLHRNTVILVISYLHVFSVHMGGTSDSLFRPSFCIQLAKIKIIPVFIAAVGVVTTKILSL